MYTKRTERYDGENFIIKVEDVPYIKGIMVANIFDKNEYLVKMFEESYENDDEKKRNKLDMLLSAQISKEIFEGFKKQKQFKKLNVIIYNPLRSYESLLEEISNSYKELQEAKKLLESIEKQLKRNPNINDIDISGKKYPSFSREMAEFLKKTDFYANFKILSLMDVHLNAEEKELNEMNAIVGAGIKVIEKGLTIEDILKDVNVGFRRYEIDFEKETLSIYNSYAKMYFARPKEFKPWYGDLYEELESKKTFKEIKKEMIESHSIFYDQEEVFKEMTLGGVESFATKEKFEKAIEEAYGKCPIGQLTPLAQAISHKLIDPKILGAVSLILSNNLIKKEVERTRVLKKTTNNNKKKKKGGSMYKSIVKEWYVYDKQVIDEMSERAENKIRENNKEESYMDKIQNMRRKVEEERHYEKEEWEVKPHVRTLKDGRKVLVSGQKRKRRQELLENDKKEPNVKTYGMSPTDVEKIVKNATEK